MSSERSIFRTDLIVGETLRLDGGRVTVLAFDVKLGSDLVNVHALLQNARRAAQAQLMEIDRNITRLKRDRQRNGIDDDEFQDKVGAQNAKKLRVIEEFRDRVGG